MAMERVVQTTCMRRAYSVLVWGVQTGSVAVPSDMPYLMYLLKKAIVSGRAYPPVSNENDENDLSRQALLNRPYRAQGTSVAFAKK